MMQAPEAVIQSLADRVQPVPITFQGFTLGTTNKEFFQSYPFYRNTRAILLRRPVPFGEEIIYRGNHKDRDIKATSLTFMCGKLVEIRLFLNHEGDAPEELLKQYISLPLPDGYPLQAGARFLKDPLDIPATVPARPCWISNAFRKIRGSRFSVMKVPSRDMAPSSLPSRNPTAL